MRLFRFDYSCYARKVQMVLDLLGMDYELVDVPFLDRSELLRYTKGYVQVPVLVMDSGVVLMDSRLICQNLLVGEAAEKLIPTPLEGPIWAYADWIDNLLEDTVFRFASPGIRARFKSLEERALFTFIKERKFGTGCIEQWERERDRLIERARVQLRPTLQTLSSQPFLFGQSPTLADACLYGQMMMLAVADPELPAVIALELKPWMERLEQAAGSKRR